MSKSKKKDEDEIKLEFIGNNAIDVTGSMIKITFHNKTMLLDCGMIQGEGTILNTFQANKNMMEQIKGKDVDFVIISHAHCDHTSCLPVLYKSGFKGKIFCNYKTFKLIKPLLIDSAFINKKDAIAIGKQKTYTVTPLFDENDVENTLKLVQIADMDNICHISDDIYLKFIGNNHICGSTQVELYFHKKSNKVIKIHFTGDLGNPKIHKPFTDEMEYCTTSNLSIFESTYGQRSRGIVTKKTRAEDIVKITNLVDEIILKNKGQILIPSFSLQRTQEFLVMLYDIFKHNLKFKDIPILVDSRLTMEVTDVYKELMTGKDLDIINNITQWDNVKFIKDIHETNACIGDNEPRIILSAQGMLSAGHSSLWCQHIVSDEKSAILFIGFASEHSVAGRLKVKDSKTIRIENKVYRKNCKIEELQSFSSHMQRNELIEYMKMINTDKIVLVHGNKKAKNELQEDSIQALRDIGKTTKIECAYKNMVIKL